MKEGDRPSVADVQRKLRNVLHTQFPDEIFFFQAANITNQILNFGIPAPIDVQVMGRDQTAAYTVAQDLEHRLKVIPGAVDVHIRQVMDAPRIDLNVDRAKAGQAGLTQANVSNSMLISLSGSGQVAPNQWLNPVNGVSYSIGVQTPQSRIDSLDALGQTPISAPGGTAVPQLLDNLLSGTNRNVTAALLNHYNVQPVFDIYANTDRRDLGGVAKDIQKVLDDNQQECAERSDRQPAGPGGDDGGVVPPAERRSGIRDPADLSADGCQLPVLAGSFYHSDCAARSFRGHSVDAVCDPDDDQRALSDGRHHGGRRGDGKQHSPGDVRQR